MQQAATPQPQGSSELGARSWELDSPISASCCRLGNLQLVCIENLLLRSLAATGMAGDGDGEASETIYGIAAIVANCKCCGKQVN